MNYIVRVGVHVKKRQYKKILRGFGMGKSVKVVWREDKIPISLVGA